MDMCQFALWKYHNIEGRYSCYRSGSFDVTHYDDGEFKFDIMYNHKYEKCIVEFESRQIKMTFEQLLEWIELNGFNEAINC